MAETKSLAPLSSSFREARKVTLVIQTGFLMPVLLNACSSWWRRFLMSEGSVAIARWQKVSLISHLHIVCSKVCCLQGLIGPV